MTLGDLLEIAGALVVAVAVLLVVAGSVSWIIGFGSALLVIGLFLGYQAQAWASTPLPTHAGVESEEQH